MATKDLRSQQPSSSTLLMRSLLLLHWHFIFNLYPPPSSWETSCLVHSYSLFKGFWVSSTHHWLPEESHHMDTQLQACLGVTTRTRNLLESQGDWDTRHLRYMTRPFSAGMPEHHWEAGRAIETKRSLHGLSAHSWSVGYTGEVALCQLM